jgi:tetratricopeptide (TPR) repeat protein
MTESKLAQLSNLPAPRQVRLLARLAAASLIAVWLAGCAGFPGRPADGDRSAPLESAAQQDPDSPTGGDGADRPRAAASDADANLPSVDLSREILFQVLAAEVAVQRGQVAPAAATYLALAQSTRDPRLARRATELALTERSLEHALQAAQLWYELAPNTPNAAQTVESLWLATNRLTEAEPLLAARLERARKDGTLPAAYQQLQRTLARASDKEGALALLERLSRPDENVVDARLALAALAGSAGQPERAAAEATAALNLHPDDERAAVSAAQYVQQTKLGNPGAAQLLEKFLKKQPKAIEARYAYARVLAADGKTDAARGQMEIALKEEPDSPAILFALAQLAYQLKQIPVAEGYLKRYIALPRSVQRDNVPAYLFLAQIAEDNKRLDEAISWLEQVTRGEQYLPAVMRRALLMGKQKKVNEARELLHSTDAPTSRERVQLTSAEAQLLRDAQRYDEAFEVLDHALERLPTNPELLYDHAMAAEKIDRLQVMETDLRKLIELRPDYAHAYNALGYSLAERNLRLEEAQVLIEKAIALAPDDAHIIDSLGWVHFRRGQYDRAIEQLRKAYEIKPEAEIAAHLGEVLWKSGRSADARQMWLEAQRLDPTNETLKETLARLNVAL